MANIIFNGPLHLRACIQCTRITDRQCLSASLTRNISLGYERRCPLGSSRRLYEVHIGRDNTVTGVIVQLRKVTTSRASPKPPALPKLQPPTPQKSVLSNAHKGKPHRAYQIILGSKDTSTLLYKAPSHTSYFASTYLATSFFYIYAYYNLQTIYLHPPEGLATWVSTSFGGICALMAATGTYILLGPTKLIRSINAVPVKDKKGASGELIELEIELRKMVAVPDFVWPRRVLRVKPEDCVLEHVLYTPPPPGYEVLGTLQPTNRFSKAFYSIFEGAKRTFTRSGFVQLEVGGKPYKLDVSPGAWGLRDGKALDALIKVKL